MARKIDEGETIRDPDPSGYFYAVARNILLEHWNEHGREKTILRTLVPRDETSAQKLEQERRLRCLERCLLQLLPETRQLILRYYNGERRAKIQNRKEIAGELRVPISALRIRMHRLRSRLESCVEKCLTRSLGGETDLVSGHKKGGDERS